MSDPRTDLAWFSLFSMKGFGPKRLHALRRAAQVAGLEVTDLPVMAREGLDPHILGLGAAAIEALRNVSIDSRQRDFTHLRESGVAVVHLDHPGYPSALVQRMGDSAPSVLFCKGTISILAAPGIALVGSRHASPPALEIARATAHAIACAGMNVISGYAGGIDTQAHLGALEADGTTTLVLSSGIMDFSRKPVFAHVRWEGNVLAISQFDPNMKWNARSAMVRNKLACALAQAVLVVESGVHRPGKMSGTFDTGLSALKLGVPLFVIEPRTLPSCPPGNTELIKRGGTAVAPADAVAAIMADRRVRCSASPADDHDPQLSLL
jgi:DNA processing protein